MRSKIIACCIIAWSICGLLIFPFPAIAQQEQEVDTTFIDEPEAHALYDKMVETMRNAETMYYESEYRWGAQDKELGHAIYKLWMKKANYTRLEATSYNGKCKGIFIVDSEHSWIYWPTGRPYPPNENSDEYKKTRFNMYMKDLPGYWSIAHQTDKLGVNMSMTVIDPSTFHGYTDALQPYIDGVRSVGIEKVGEEECDVIEVSFMKHQRSWYLWLSKQDHVPRKLKSVIRVSNEIIASELWSDVRLNDEISMDKFTWNPPEGWVEYKSPKLEDGLLEQGTKAPDFDLVLTDGNRCKLSDYHGKIVWLVFWRVGCPACRKEAHHLKKIYSEYKDKGLVVLGFNCMDDKQIALDFLKENAITFLNIIDSSDSANKTYNQDYQKLKGRSAVPLTYIIDRDGKVAGAFYGYEEDDKRGIEILQKLGIK